VFALVDPLEALHSIIEIGASAGRVADLVQDQASDFVKDLEDEFGFLRDAGDAAEDVVDVVEDIGGDPF
jgi:hypothetical protein